MRRKKILVVEDDVDLGRLVHQRLKASGFDPFVVPDAVLGFQEALRRKPDLILLDLMLPAGGGLAVLKGLRRSVYTAHIPVLVVSGIEQDFYEGHDCYLKKVHEMGIEGYLGKPFESGQLLSRIEQILA